MCIRDRASPLPVHPAGAFRQTSGPVSYTHLDVYKRQGLVLPLPRRARSRAAHMNRSSTSKSSHLVCFFGKEKPCQKIFRALGIKIILLPPFLLPSRLYCRPRNRTGSALTARGLTHLLGITAGSELAGLLPLTRPRRKRTLNLL